MLRGLQSWEKGQPGGESTSRVGAHTLPYWHMHRTLGDTIWAFHKSKYRVWCPVGYDMLRCLDHWSEGGFSIGLMSTRQIFAKRGCCLTWGYASLHDCVMQCRAGASHFARNPMYIRDKLRGTDSDIFGNASAYHISTTARSYFPITLWIASLEFTNPSCPCALLLHSVRVFHPTSSRDDRHVMSAWAPSNPKSFLQGIRKQVDGDLAYDVKLVARGTNDGDGCPLPLDKAGVQQIRSMRPNLKIIDN